jgi:peptidoglycan L-alanyl-D-glutamate endopeptidase CwlK
MIDQVTLQRIELIHPKLRIELRKIYFEICDALTGNLGCRFVQVFRSFKEQDALFAQGRNGNDGDVVTDAKGGQSYHNYGLAVDFCLIWDKDKSGKISGDEIVWNRNTDIDKDSVSDWMEVVRIFLKYGWKWGASFKDYPHFEKTLGYNWRDLLQKYNDGKFLAGGTYLDI